jgi:branched-chain amino acid transport system substrate-binding protein
MKKFLLAAALIAALPVHAAETYDIDVVLALTGYGAFLTKQEVQTLKLMEEVTNGAGGIHGKPVRFVLHDDQSSSQTAVQLATQLMTSRPAVILGPNIAADCGAVGPLMLKNGPVNYCMSAAYHPPKGSYVFISGVSTRAQMVALVRYYRLKGYTRLALASATDASGQDGDFGLADAMKLPENQGMQVVEKVHFNISDVSVTAQAERIKQANPQAILVWCLGSSFGTMLRGLSQSGIDLPVGTTAGNMTLAQMQQFAAFLPTHLFFGSPPWPVGSDSKVKLPETVLAKQKDFHEAYARAHAQPDEGALLAWDPAVIIIDALRKLPEGATAQQLRDHLLSLRDQPGIGGIYDFVNKEPQNGLSVEDVVVSEWNKDRGSWIPVSQLGGEPLE